MTRSSIPASSYTKLPPGTCQQASHSTPAHPRPHRASDPRSKSTAEAAWLQADVERGSMWGTSRSDGSCYTSTSPEHTTLEFRS